MFKFHNSEVCLMCTECCKNYPFIELSPDEIRSLEKFTALKADEFTYPKDKAGTEHFLKFKDNGECFFLEENDGSYSCSVYSARSHLCKEYPSTQIQKEVCKKKWQKSQSNKLASKS